MSERPSGSAMRFMAPEQVINKDVSPAVDIYALSVILYEMLTGGIPYSADTQLAILMVGVVETLLTVGFIFGARPSDRPMYIVSFIVRLIAGYLAGVVAARAASRGVESSAEPIRIQAPRS